MLMCFCHNNEGDLLFNVLISEDEKYSFNFSKEGGMEKANEFLEAFQKALPMEVLEACESLEDLARVASNFK